MDPNPSSRSCREGPTIMKLENQMAMLLTDRAEDGNFEISRNVFTDPSIFALEQKYIFEALWTFVGLDTQIPKANDFLTTHIGSQPILLTRKSDGSIGCFLNTCRHRGTVVCPFKRGRQKFHVCRYHGWAYDSDGRNTAVTDRDDGQYPADFDGMDRNLIPVAKLASYRGLIFASLSPDVPPLEEYLGDAATFIDLIVDQSPVRQVEFVPGDVTYTFDANWKLQFENGLDYYHFNSTHSSYVDILRKRAEKSSGDLPQEAASEQEGQGSFSFKHGHAVNWSIKRVSRYARPLSSDPDNFRAVTEKVGAERVKWMMRQRNLTIFPNLQLIDISSSQLRTWRPLSADKTEMTSHCIAPVGESSESRRLRIRNYEDFFNPSGLATSDDNVMYEFCQSGYAAAGGSTLGYLRGLGSARIAQGPHAAELGIEPDEYAFGAPGFGGETNFHAGYREWYRILSEAASK